MVTRSKKQNTSKKEEKKGRVKVDKLKLNKETVKNLTHSEQKQAKGGVRGGEQWSVPECLSYTCVTVCTRNLECI